MIIYNFHLQKSASLVYKIPILFIDTLLSCIFIDYLIYRIYISLYKLASNCFYEFVLSSKLSNLLWTFNKKRFNGTITFSPENAMVVVCNSILLFILFNIIIPFQRYLFFFFIQSFFFFSLPYVPFLLFLPFLILPCFKRRVSC